MNKGMIAALLLPIALAACAASAPEAASPAVGEPTGAADASVANDLAATLPRYHWRLQEAKAADGRRIGALFVRADKPLTLDFAAGRIGIGNACNRIGGGYALENDRLAVARLASTMMACSDPKLMALDREATSRLEGGLAAALEGGDPPRLTLTTASGDVLAFTGEPTAATRYGSAGETVFLEVAAQTRPCPHPLIPDKQCLQVRELRYDDQGLRTGTPGAFEHFYQDIEGYAHEPGIRNVLRVKRYPVKDPPADAPSTAYVLDMVVESENTRR